MKKIRGKRIWQSAKVVLMTFVLVLSALLLWNQKTYAAKKNGWVNNYYYVDGVKQKSKWIKVGQNTYYVDNKGKKVTGWKKIKNRYYFFNEEGKTYNSSKDIGVRLTKLSNNVLTMGIDVSQWQGNVDWQAVQDAGVDFVMLRLGYGKGRYGNTECELDVKFKQYVEEIQEVGIAIGIYFYSYATTPKEAQEEAIFTIENIQGIPIEFPIAYDLEDPYVLNNTTTQTRTEMTTTFMDTIAAAGYHPMYYTNQNWYENYLDSDVLAGYDFWYARYTYEEPSAVNYPYNMWQATSTQKIDGITDNTVDIDFLYKDYFATIKTRAKALKYGWYTEDGKLRYYYKGKAKKSGWLSIAGQKYYFTASAACKGWKTIKGKKYYFNRKGEMLTGIRKISGKYYMFNDVGVLQMSTDEPGIKINSKGVCKITKGWYKDSTGKYFYRKADGNRAKSTWISKSGKKYYCDADGYRVTGFYTIGNGYYYFSKAKGVMKTGWLTYAGKKYYFRTNGTMVSGKSIKINGKKYTFDANGVLKK